LQKAINKQKERNPLLIYSAFCLDHFRFGLPAEYCCGSTNVPQPYSVGSASVGHYLLWY
jgi:hypothetical protein